jgi:hypothetical protein
LKSTGSGRRRTSSGWADGLERIKGGEDHPPFWTIAEINRLLERRGLTYQEVRDLWECLHLSPEEIAGLLAIVRANAKITARCGIYERVAC